MSEPQAMNLNGKWRITAASASSAPPVRTVRLSYFIPHP